MEILQRIKTGSDFWPNDPTSSNIPKGTQNTYLKEHKQPYVHFGILYRHKDVKVAQVSIRRWVDQTIWDIYTMKYYVTVKKKKILPFEAAWIDLENIMLSEMRQL